MRWSTGCGVAGAGLGTETPFFMQLLTHLLAFFFLMPLHCESALWQHGGQEERVRAAAAKRGYAGRG